MKLLSNTVLKNYPLFCPKCKKEVIINAEHLHISVVKEERYDTIKIVNQLNDRQIGI